MDASSTDGTSGNDVTMSPRSLAAAALTGMFESGSSGGPGGNKKRGSGSSSAATTSKVFRRREGATFEAPANSYESLCLACDARCDEWCG